jgi:hypothetical protein
MDELGLLREQNRLLKRDNAALLVMVKSLRALVWEAINYIQGSNGNGDETSTDRPCDSMVEQHDNGSSGQPWHGAQCQEESQGESNHRSPWKLFTTR